MNITQLSEHLKDVPQNTLVGYAKSPNSVVPQFLALAEIQRRQQLQSAGAGQPPARTVAEDVLDQANPQPQMQPQMQAQVPPQPQVPMAAPMAQQLPENQPGVASLPTGMPQGMAGGGIVAFASGGDAEDEDEEGLTEEESQIMSLLSGLKSRARGVIDALPKSYEATKAAANSSGIANLDVAKRGTHPLEEQAIAAAKQVGLDPNLMLHALYKETGGLKNPETAMSKAGAYGPMQIMEATARELGINRKNTYENLLGGATYLKQQVDRFKDPVLGLAAYNAGPGRVSEMLKRGSGIESLPRETQGYVKMAEGGIAHFAQGDVVEPEYSLSPGESIVNIPQETQAIDPFQSYIARQAQEREELKKNAEQDKYLALMQAGFGIMGGTSPYAMTNIGQGALQGISTYGALQKQRAAELASFDKSELGGLRAKELSKISQAKLDELTAAREEKSDISRERLAATKERIQAGRTAAEQTAEAKKEANITAALSRAAADPQYKKFADLLKDTPPDDPMYQYYLDSMEAIKDAYFSSTGIKQPRVKVSLPPLPPPPPEKPGFLDTITQGARNLFGTNQPSAAPAGRMRFDAQGNPIQ